METVALLLLFVLIVGGVFWIIRKNESLSCHSCEDHSHLAPYKIEAPEVKQTAVEEKTPNVNFSEIRPGLGTVANTTQNKPAKQKTPRMQPVKKESVQPKAQKPQQGQKKPAPPSKTAPKPAVKQTKNAPVPAKSTPRAPRAKKSNS